METSTSKLRPIGIVASVLLCLIPAAALSAPTVAVIATDKCDRSSTALHAKSYHQALSAHLGDELLSQAGAVALLGGAPSQFVSLGEVERLLTGATADVFQDQSGRALRTLRGVAEDVALLPPSAARYAALVDILSLVAHIHLKSVKTDPIAEATAAAAFERILRVDPGWGPNIDLYPPSTRNFVAQLRNKLKKSPRLPLTVTTRPSGLPVYVNAKPIGPSPQTISLPAGAYSVEVDWGEGKRGLAKQVAIEQQPANVELDLAFEGSVYPDTLCVRTEGTRQGRLTIVARLAAILGVKTVHAIREEEPAEQERFVTAMTLKSYGEERVEGRIKLYAGNLSPSAWDSFVSFMLSGEKPVPPVEALRGLATKPAPIVEAKPVVVEAPVPAVDRSPSNGLRAGAYIAGAIGLAAAGTAVFFGVQALDSKQKIDALCATGSCGASANYDPLERSRRTGLTIAAAAGIGGGVAVVAGLVMLVLSGQTQDSDPVRVSIEPTGTGMRVRF